MTSSKVIAVLPDLKSAVGKRGTFKKLHILVTLDVIIRLYG
jgi:hypothetical protein